MVTVVCTTGRIRRLQAFTQVKPLKAWLMIRISRVPRGAVTHRLWPTSTLSSLIRLILLRSPPVMLNSAMIMTLAT